MSETVEEDYGKEREMKIMDVVLMLLGLVYIASLIHICFVGIQPASPPPSRLLPIPSADEVYVYDSENCERLFNHITSLGFTDRPPLDLSGVSIESSSTQPPEWVIEEWKKFYNIQ